MINMLKLMFKYKVFVVAALLTFVLSSMIYGRISILKTGKEIVLLSRPIDPRDLFRGHYVIMRYGINSLDSCKIDVQGDLRRKQMVFVQLEEGKDGYWKAVALSTRPLPSTETTVILSGYTQTRYRASSSEKCRRIFVRYGLEKYFAPKKRAKELENMRAGRSGKNAKATAEIEVLSEKMLKVRKKLQAYYKEQRHLRTDGVLVVSPKMKKKQREYMEELDEIHQKIRALRQEARAKIAVIVRVSESGEGAISGIMIDGKKVYDEPF